MEENNSILHSKKNVIKIIIFFVVVIIIAAILAIYLSNNELRTKVDNFIFNNDVVENTSNIIEINNDSNPYVYAFDKYITVLTKNTLTLYTQDATEYMKFDVSITNPYVEANDKYLVLAESGGNKIYLITSEGIKWEKDVEGDIYRVSVNENGYVSAILKNTTYKSIVSVYDFDGNELFKSFLAKSYAICSEISANNKFLAIGQIDYSGTVVKSIVKLISIETAQNNSQESILYTYESESSKILTNINFNDKNEAICMFDSYIQKIKNSSDERIYDINSDDMFVDVNLKNNIAILSKENSGLFSYEYQVIFKNTTGKSDSLYILENDVPKKLKVNKDLMCIYFAGELRIVNSNGWLLKKYKTNTEIQDIVIGNNLIGVVYNNKIEIVSL